MLRLAINEVRRVKEGGLLILALPCCSFCKPCPPQRFGLPCLSICSRKKTDSVNLLLRNQGTHQRSLLFPNGNAGYPSVACGNLLAARTMLLAALGMALGLRILIEQPAQSTLEWHPSFEWLTKYFEAGKFQVLNCLHFPMFWRSTKELSGMVFTTSTNQRPKGNGCGVMTRNC